MTQPSDAPFLALPDYIQSLNGEKRRQWTATANRLLTEGETIEAATDKANGAVLGNRKASEIMQARLERMAERRGEREIDQAAHQAATSPQNDLPQPTDAQIKAGNYKKGHASIHGLAVTIENPAGSTRSGQDANGEAWSVTMTAHYGYLRRTVGADDEQMDCYIGPNEASERVFVINQVDADTGKFDEHKVIFGTNTLAEAIALYDAHFSDGKGHLRRTGISELTVPEFKEWLNSGTTKLKTAGDPTSNAVHVNGMTTTAKKRKNPHFMNKLCSLMTNRYSDEEMSEMVGKARAHAGGMSKAEAARLKKAMGPDCDDLEMMEDGEEEDMGEKGEKGKDKKCAEPLNCLTLSEKEGDKASLTSKLRRIEQQFYDHFAPLTTAANQVPQPARYWPQEIWDDYIIARASETDRLFKVPYTCKGDGACLFGSPVEVVVRYEMRKQFTDTLELDGNLADLCANEHGTRLFMEYEFAEPPEWMPLLPTPGNYKHPKYGKLDISKERSQNFINNFKDGKYQSSLPINGEHEPGKDGAHGWIEELRMNDNGSVDARVKWTDLGTEAIRNDRFRYISPEWQDVWTNALGEKFKDVLVGAALTVRPFFKDSYMRPLVANESGLALAEPVREASDKTQMFFFTALQPITLPAPEAQAHPEPIKELPVMSTENKGAAPAVDAQAFAELQETVKNLSERDATRAQEVKTLKDTNEAQTATIKILSETNERLLTDARTKTFNDKIKGRVEGGRAWHGDHAKHLDMLEKLVKAFGEESDMVKDYIAQQETIAKQFAESNLFVELGSDASGASAQANASQILDTKARELMKGNAALTFAEAMGQLMQDPAMRQLYNEHSGSSVVDVNKRYGKE